MTQSGNGGERRGDDRRAGPPDRRTSYRRGLGRYDRRLTGDAETDVPEDVKKLRVGPSDRRGSEVRIRRQGPVERRIAQRRQGPEGETPA